MTITEAFADWGWEERTAEDRADPIRPRRWHLRRVPVEEIVPEPKITFSEDDLGA